MRHFRPNTTQNAGRTNNFKEYNKQMIDFQKSEARFINKFVRECDNVSLKINRFASAVMPISDKTNEGVNQSKARQESTADIKIRVSPNI